MNYKTLKNIKEQLRELLIVAKQLEIQFLTSYTTQLTTIKVLVYNASFDGTNCSNYSHNNAVEELYTIQETLRVIANYEKSHISSYIYNQLNFIIDGNVMCEDYDKI